MTELSEIVFGSRRSKLALWQTHAVANAMVTKYPKLTFRIVEIDTAGDKIIDQPLPEIGGKGLFTAELDSAIADGSIDIAVHSLKDLPTQCDDAIEVIPVLPREDPSDVLISNSNNRLQDLPTGASIGTSSPRRQSQILALRQDLSVSSIRGNVPTRIRKVANGDYDATILAFAGVKRVNMMEHVAENLALEYVLPAPGQGAIAATFASTNRAVREIVDTLVDQATVACVECERKLLANLGGGCSAPIAALATMNEDKMTTLIGRVGSVDGQTQITKTETGTDIEQIARVVATEILEAGGSEILKQSESH